MDINLFYRTHPNRPLYPRQILRIRRKSFAALGQVLPPDIVVDGGKMLEMVKLNGRMVYRAELVSAEEALEIALERLKDWLIERENYEIYP